MDTDQILTDEKTSTSKSFPRKCSQCGADMVAGRKSGRVLCPECRVKNKKASHKKYRTSERGRENSKAACKRWREKHPDKVLPYGAAYREAHREELRAARRAKYRENIVFEREAGKLRNRMLRGKPGAKLDYYKHIGKAQTCPRMRVTMLQLPCGKRQECWGGKPCERTLGKTKPRFDDPSSWMY